ncbi:hypothetical protein BKA70DRAFT_1315384 [Coprinopsis sp. MPI-PUGE-AT-0042]|nr:hypothetical protein BKA70DRAFT_1315384 [Coprinopsis sp. MPI-PUGE-AT-0042]
MWAAVKGREASLRALLPHPTLDVNLADNEGRTPLLRASLMGLKTAKILRTHPRIDETLADKKGRTPLQYALRGAYTMGRTRWPWARKEWAYKEMMDLVFVNRHSINGAPSHISIPNTCDAPHASPSHRLEGHQVGAGPQAAYGTLPATHKLSEAFDAANPLFDPCYYAPEFHPYALQTSTPLSHRTAEKRPAYDSDDEAATRLFRLNRHLG